MRHFFAVTRDEPLRLHTTLGLGGAAQFFCPVSGFFELKAACRWAHQEKLPLAVIGGGSNLVVADEGFAGLVLKMDLPGLQVRKEADSVVLEIAAGTPLDQLVALSVEEGWAGLECLSGIPGSVGAAPVQNVGAYGQEIAERVQWVEAFHHARGRLVRLTPQQCRFAYRESRFRRAGNPLLITRVALRLYPGGKPCLRYPELRQALNVHYAAPGLSEVREAVLALRRRKGMVLLPEENTFGTVGSFFKNPLLSWETFARWKKMLWEQGILPPHEPPPHYPHDCQVKIPAAWLVEHAGFPKGFRVGAVGVSPQHALALVHFGGGTSRELLALAATIQEEVHRRFCVLLEPEPGFLGFGGKPPLRGALLV